MSMRSLSGSQRPNQSATNASMRSQTAAPTANSSQRSEHNSLRPKTPTLGSNRSNGNAGGNAGGSPAANPTGSGGGAARPASAERRPSSASQHAQPIGDRPSWNSGSKDSRDNSIVKRMQRAKEELQKGFDEQGAEYDIYGAPKAKPEGHSSRLQELRKIQLAIRKQLWTKGASGLRSFLKDFEERDRSMSGQCNLADFRGILDKQGVLISEMEARYLFQFYDITKSGFVQYKDIFNGVRGELTQSRVVVLRQGFRKLGYGSGRIMMDDLKQFQSERTARSREDPLLNNFITQFNTKEKPHDFVSFEEYEDYFAGVSATFDSDDAFVQAISMTFKL